MSQTYFKSHFQKAVVWDIILPPEITNSKSLKQSKNYITFRIPVCLVSVDIELLDAFMTCFMTSKHVAKLNSCF